MANLTIEEIDEEGWFAKDDTRLTKIERNWSRCSLYINVKLFDGLIGQHNWSVN